MSSAGQTPLRATSGSPRARLVRAVAAAPDQIVLVFAAVFLAAAICVTFGVMTWPLFVPLAIVLSAVVMAVWMAVVPSTRSSEGEVILVGCLIAAYTYCYCLTAAVFRRLLTGSAFRAGYTWIIVALLFGLGLAVPFIFGFAFFERSARYGSNEMVFLYLSNPVVMIDDATRSSDTSLGLTIAFLVVWGGVVTAVNAPWFVKQVTNFRRPEPKGEAGE